MIIHYSNVNEIALYIDAGEMAACGFDELCKEDAVILAEAAITDLGLAGALSEIEAFSGNGGAMIFASLRARPTIMVLRFLSLNCLLDAARAAGKLAPERSTLFSLDGTYLLLAYNASAAFSCFISEYAPYVSAVDYSLPFIFEHGKLLAENNALARLSGLNHKA